MTCSGWKSTLNQCLLTYTLYCKSRLYFTSNTNVFESALAINNPFEALKSNLNVRASNDVHLKYALIIILAPYSRSHHNLLLSFTTIISTYVYIFHLYIIYCNYTPMYINSYELLK